MKDEDDDDDIPFPSFHLNSHISMDANLNIELDQLVMREKGWNTKNRSSGIAVALAKKNRSGSGEFD